MALFNATSNENWITSELNIDNFWETIFKGAAHVGHFERIDFGSADRNATHGSPRVKTNTAKWRVKRIHFMTNLSLVICWLFYALVKKKTIYVYFMKWLVNFRCSWIAYDNIQVFIAFEFTRQKKLCKTQNAVFVSQQ